MSNDTWDVEFNGKVYNQKPGSPFDRGASDSFYRRNPDPHYRPMCPGSWGTRVGAADMTAEQIDAYHAGYAYNEELGIHKEY